MKASSKLLFIKFINESYASQNFPTLPLTVGKGLTFCQRKGKNSDLVFSILQFDTDIDIIFGDFEIVFVLTIFNLLAVKNRKITEFSLFIMPTQKLMN